MSEALNRLFAFLIDASESLLNSQATGATASSFWSAQYSALATFHSVDNGDDYINCHFLLLVRVFQCDAGLVFLNLGCIVAKRSPHGALSWSIWHKFHLQFRV